MQYVGLFVLIVLACLLLNGIKGCDRDRFTGAMCYKIAAPLTTAEYLCPVCGNKTLYDKDQVAWVVQSMEACRREFSLLARDCPLKMSLDESSFCAKCSPNATEHQLVLTITEQDGTTRTVAPVRVDDLSLLRDYFRGRLSKRNPEGDPMILQGQTIRLQRLLGNSLPDPNSMK